MESFEEWCAWQAQPGYLQAWLDHPESRKCYDGWLADQQAKQAQHEAPRVERLQAEVAELRRELATLKQAIKDDDKDLQNLITTLMTFIFGEKDDQADEKPLGALWGCIVHHLNEAKFVRERGVWDAETKYMPGALVTHGGAGWVAQLETKGARPGDAAGCWRLAIKSDTAELKRQVTAEVTKQLSGKVPVVR